MEWTLEKEREDEENYRRGIVGVFGKARKELREAERDLAETEGVINSFDVEIERHKLSEVKRAKIKELKKRIEAIRFDILKNIEELKGVVEETEKILGED